MKKFLIVFNSFMAGWNFVCFIREISERNLFGLISLACVALSLLIALWMLDDYKEKVKEDVV